MTYREHYTIFLEDIEKKHSILMEAQKKLLKLGDGSIDLTFMEKLNIADEDLQIVQEKLRSLILLMLSRSKSFDDEFTS